jgi:integrase/recombinase XerC
VTFSAFVAAYLDGMRQTQRRSEKTIEAYSRDLKQAAQFFGEEIELSAIDPLSIIGWVRALSSQRITGRSISRKLSGSAGFFKKR